MMIERIDKALAENANNTPIKGMPDLEEEMRKRNLINANNGLRALNMSGKPIYAGTADPEVVKKRRAKNKRAASNRRKNRK
jgi:hypothetical protein